VTFPTWNSSGVIPAVRPGLPGHDPDRSPYRTRLTDFVDYFCFSPERIEIAEGLLNYRSELHQLGMTKGFQWLNGSFSENVEVNEHRSPNDVDVVSFVSLPASFNTPASIASKPDLFDQYAVKNTFKVDAYFHQLGLPQGAAEIERISYWYSMWSHRRDGLWKGFVQVDLDPSEDTQARARIASLQSSGPAS